MSPVYLIAEVGVNHNGDIELAKKMVDACCSAGIDAVKFQTFKADDLVTSGAQQASYQIENTQQEETQYAMLKRLELSAADFRFLKDYCDRQGIEFLSTPFDSGSVDLLEELGVKRYKIGSGDLTNEPLIRKIAQTNKPIILSTGMANFEEIERALSWIEKESEAGCTLLHCTSNYPTAYDDVDMRAMNTLKDLFKCPVGYSDHTIGLEIPIMAVALGAEVIEKHITLDCAMKGPDHKASLPVDLLPAFVSMIRHVESAFGSPSKTMRDSEKEIAAVARKSVVAVRDLPKGSILAWEDLTIKRPGFGVEPRFLSSLIGKRLRREVKADLPLMKRDVEL